MPIVWPGGCIYKADLQEGFGRGAKENAVRPKDLFSGIGIRCCVGTGNQVAQGYTWSTLAGIQVSSGAEYHVAGYYIMPIGPRTGSLPCRGRGHRTACTPRRAHRSRGGPGLYPADLFGVLGTYGLYADWRHCCRHDTDAGLSACAVRDLVQNSADRRLNDPCSRSDSTHATSCWRRGCLNHAFTTAGP